MYTNADQHKIKIPKISQPIYQRPYKLPYFQRTEVEKQIKQMEQDNIIIQSDRPWNAPRLVITKKADASGEKR